MFCPVCGRQNSRELKFCVSCGTDLLVVSQALSESKSDFLSKTDAALDQLIARYAERVFKSAPANASERTLGNSWRVLGQGVTTSFVDIILFSLMWNIFPIKFLFLLILTPIRVLLRRNDKQKAPKAVQGSEAISFPEPASNKWLPEQVASVSEHTTERLAEYNPARQDRAGERD